MTGVGWGVEGMLRARVCSLGFMGGGEAVLIVRGKSEKLGD